ncbi:hypothetical protein FQR65_LT04888 [Abscondita terminalis]|nr:hypothetical protein FQR65_LT04888 [Abscondita terminalis]
MQRGVGNTLEMGNATLRRRLQRIEFGVSNSVVTDAIRRRSCVCFGKLIDLLEALRNALFIRTLEQSLIGLVYMLFLMLRLELIFYTCPKANDELCILWIKRHNVHIWYKKIEITMNRVDVRVAFAATVGVDFLYVFINER